TTPAGVGGLGLLTGAGKWLIQFDKSSPPDPVASSHEQYFAQKNSMIEGPLSQRAVIHRVIPAYPTWAEEQGITGTTRLHFTVTKDGEVKPDIQITLTSGRPELDQLAIEALRHWHFAPSPFGDSSQWGIITFFFSLAR